MKNVKKHLTHLQFLAHCSPKLRKLVLKNADKDLILAVCECMYNFMNGNVKVDENIMKKTQKHKNHLRKLFSDGSLSKKKDVLVQHGGFLPILIPTILEVVSSLIKSQ